jgi:cytochrome c biogenesis protein CcdA
MSSGVLENASAFANVTKYAVDMDAKGRDLFLKVVDNYKIQAGVPTLVIYKDDWKNGYVIQGDTPIIDNLLPLLKKLSALKNETHENNETKVIGAKPLNLTFLKTRDPLTTIFVVVSVALSDSINPCIISILALLLATLRTLKKKDEVITLGGLYIIVVFLTYLFIGVLLARFLSLINTIIAFGLPISNIINMFIAIIVFAVGLINIKEIFIYGVGPSLMMPDKEKEKIIELIKKGTVLGVLATAVIVTIIEFPCSGIMYLGIIQDMLNIGISDTMFAIYLFIYNIIFVLPLVIMVGAAAIGQDVERVVDKFESERIKYRKLIRLVMGIVLILLAMWIFPWEFVRGVLSQFL